MQTYLIASNNSNFIETQIKDILRNLRVLPVNLITLDPQTSVTIADVRKISGLAMLKPYGGGERLIIIKNMDKATVEAENALLKILEEPPMGTYIILVCENMNKLLPTIISRCQIIADNKKKPPLADENDEGIKLLTQILESSPGERILLSQKCAASREEALNILTNLLFTLEHLLHHPKKNIPLSTLETTQLLTKVNAAKNYVERYINFKATLDVLFLGFPKK